MLLSDYRDYMRMSDGRPYEFAILTYSPSLDKFAKRSGDKIFEATSKPVAITNPPLH